MVQTAGSSNPQAAAEGQITGVKNAAAFRDRLFAARDAHVETVTSQAPSQSGGVFYASVPSAAHAVQNGTCSPELQQLQEINAGIKQASFWNLLFEVHDSLTISCMRRSCSLCNSPGPLNLTAIELVCLVGLLFRGHGPFCHLDASIHSKLTSETATSCSARLRRFECLRQQIKPHLLHAVVCD
jgi:hypothetical protein